MWGLKNDATASVVKRGDGYCHCKVQISLA
jgi:hypothetical protein